MLTKEHLKFRIKAGKVSPARIAVRDPAALSLASEMIEIFRGAEGSTYADLDEALAPLAVNPLAGAFKKLLLAGCEAEDDDGSIAERRWQWLEAAQAVRSALPKVSALGFAEAMAASLKVPMAQVRDGLYADLPAYRRISGVKPPLPEQLIARYNMAQVQGVVLKAKRLEVFLPRPSLAERRLLFRQLKFHRLLVDIEPRSGDDGTESLRLVLSGPLGIFDQAATYGARLANFFPHIVHVDEWQVRAEVLLRDKELELELDQTCGLVSHYQEREPYIPPELTACLDDFRVKYPAWKIVPGEEFVNMGRQSYCFPDLTISGKKARKIHVELFHRWHAGQLLSRLAALDKNPIPGLFLGVEKALAKRAEVADALAHRGEAAACTFIFAGFPTPRALHALLPKD